MAVAAQGIPDPVLWAVETLAIGSFDRVLEIGCRRGLAVSLVCAKLGRGTLTAIDRSPKMIASAEKRNAAQIASGKVRFETTALADAEFGRRRFSRIFAVNVNLFWIDPSRELPIVRKLLKPDGALHLVYEPPSPAQIKPLAARLSRHLESGGFTIDQTISGWESSGRCLCVIARPSRSPR